MNAGLGLFGTMFILECYLTNVLSQSFDTYFCFLCTLGCIICMYFSRVSKKIYCWQIHPNFEPTHIS